MKMSKNNLVWAQTKLKEARLTYDVLKDMIENCRKSLIHYQDAATKAYQEVTRIKAEVKSLEWPAVGDTYYCPFFAHPTRAYKVKNTDRATYVIRMVEMGLAFKTPTEAVEAATQLRLRVENLKQTEDLS